MTGTKGTSDDSIAEALRDAIQLLLADGSTAEGLSEIRLLLGEPDDLVHKALRLKLGKLAMEVARLVRQRSDDDRKIECRRELLGIQDTLWAMGRVSGAADTKVDDKPAVSTATGKTAKRATVNMRMLAQIQSDPESLGWNCTEWSRFLKCYRSTVCAAPTWKRLEKNRQQDKVERMRDRRRR